MARLGRVLVGVDFSECSETAARVGYALAARTSAELTLTHAHESVGGDALLPASLVDELDTTAIEESRERLRALADSLRSADPDPLNVHTEVVLGPPAVALVDALHDSDASLLVLGSRGKSRVESWLLGSVSRELSAMAPCPTLVTRAAVTKGFGGAFERVTVGIDHTATSEPLIDAASALLGEDGHLELVSCVALPAFLATNDGEEGISAGARSLTVEALAWAGKRLGELRERLGLNSERASASVALGRAAAALAKHAKDSGSDLIAVGSHSRESIADRMLGTTADRVLRHADVPVLVLPTAALDAVRIAPRGEMLVFEQMAHGACRSYLVAARNHEAMLIDPVVADIERYLAMIAARGLELVYVVDTHIHADHISGAWQLSERTGATYVVHESSSTEADVLRVCEGQRLALGKLEAQVLHTPGHTPDSMTLVFPDRMLPGDFLFIGVDGAGRTDLPGGDPGDYWDSLHKLDKIGGDMLVFPGHTLHDRRFSTLGAERHDNPRLQPRTRDDYIEWLESITLKGAEWMVDTMKANRACVESKLDRGPSSEEPP